MDIGYRAVDADNHYYEALDAFTRHLDKKFRQRGVQVVQQGTHVAPARRRQAVQRFIPNPTFDPIIVPGCIDPLFRGQIPEGVDPRSLMQVEPLRAEYQDRDARARGDGRAGPRSASLLFPTLGCGVEQALRDDIPATMATPARVQPVARRGLGLLVPGPHHRRADAVARRSRRRARRGRLAARARRAHGPRPSGARCPTENGTRPLARRPDPRPGVGAPRRGRRPGRVPPRRQRLRDVRRRRGAARDCSAFRQRSRRAQQARGVGPADPRHHRQHGRRRRVRPPPDAARREHRERLRLGARCW